MISELDVLIEICQKETDSLKLEIDLALSDWDFAGADLLKQTYLLKKGELNILQNLKNPNHTKIERLQKFIDFRKKKIKTGLDGFDYINNPNLKERLSEKQKKKYQEIIKEETKSLNELLNIPIRSNIDNDIVLGLIEELNNGSIENILFELLVNIICLNVFKSEGALVFQLVEISNPNNSNHRILKSKTLQYDLGFDMETLTKRVGAEDDMDAYQVLKIISIIVYKVCNLVGDKIISVKVS